MVSSVPHHAFALCVSACAMFDDGSARFDYSSAPFDDVYVLFDDDDW